MLEQIERFVRAGWDLEVCVYSGRKVRARVWLGIARYSHNYLGNTVDDALAGLNVFLFAKHTRMGSPTPPKGDLSC
jgi:hypothetical protein